MSGKIYGYNVVKIINNHEVNQEGWRIDELIKTKKESEPSV